MTAIETARDPVRLGLIDSGIALDHPAFRGVKLEYHLVDLNGRLQLGAAPFDSSEHGTGNVSIIVRGLGQPERLALTLVHALEGGRIVSRLAVALDLLLQKQLDILVCPFGLPGYHPVFLSAMNAFARQGCAVVAAIGNGGPGRFLSPACYKSVLAVGANNKHGQPSRFSGSMNTQAGIRLKPDVMMPGELDDVAMSDGSYGAVSGTSSATANLASLLIHLKWDYGDFSGRAIQQCISSHVRQGVASPFDNPPSLELARLALRLQGRELETPDPIMDPSPRERWIDPTISTQLAYAIDRHLLDVLLQLNSAFEEDEVQHLAIMQAFVAGINGLGAAAPVAIEYLPHARLIAVRCSAGWLRAALDEDEVLIVSGLC